MLNLTGDISLNSDINTLQKIIKKNLKIDRDHYYQGMFQQNQGDMQQTWKILNSLLQRKMRSTTPTSLNINGETLSGKDLANSFNTFFINAGAPDTTHQYVEKFMGDRVGQDFSFAPISENTLLSIIRDLKDDTAPGYDDIISKTVKDTAASIVIPLSHIINLIINTGHYPKQLKQGKVIPIHKGGTKHDLGNYRPISILPQFNILIEKCLCIQLNNFIKSQHIIIHEQYGFRPGLSTELALLKVKETVLTAFESGEVIVGLSGS